MELYAKGQLSYLMLTCLKERDFYGLDIISEISKRSNNSINLKKPSVYSNLTRMEKQGYITSYLRNSDFGPNRKYYSLTESGRKFYTELKEYFDRNNIDVFKEFKDSDVSTKDDSEKISSVQKLNEAIDDVKNDDFFDFSSLTEETSEIEEKSSPIEETSTNDYKFLESTENTTIKENTSNVVEDKCEVQDVKSIDEYNKRIYDISKDINKFKRKRSFVEDQISMTTTDPLVDSHEKTKASIEDFKNSLLENKIKYQNGETLTHLDFSRYSKSNKTSSEELKVEEEKNDAIFITQRYDAKNFERPKKIEPPRLKITVEKDGRLPAPNRDKSIDPSHKEILSKLYSKTKDGTVEEVREDALYDFHDLKVYYQKQNISFNEYKKTADKNEHNTNKIYLWVSLISIILAASLSSLLFLTLFKLNMLNAKTNFLYILLPSVLILDVIFKIYNYKKYKSWLPQQLLPQWQIWAMSLILSGLTICINFICGMSLVNFANYATTLILPLLLIIILLPIRYYVKRTLLVKHWK